MAPSVKLFTDVELLNKRTISIDVLGLQIVKETASLTYHLVETASRVVILLVVLQMLGELLNPCGKESYLYFGGTGIFRSLTELGNDCCLLLFTDHCFVLQFEFTPYPEFRLRNPKTKGRSTCVTIAYKVRFVNSFFLIRSLVAIGDTGVYEENNTAACKTAHMACHIDALFVRKDRGKRADYKVSDNQPHPSGP